MHWHSTLNSFLGLSLAFSRYHGAVEAFSPSSTVFVAPAIANSAVASSRRKPTCIYKSQVNLEEPKQEEEIEETFDPFKLSPSNGESLTVAESTELQKQEDQKQLSIWAARGVLLLVAAIWGTNFASVKYLETLCFHPPCNHPPSEAAFARFGIAALVSLPLLWGKSKEVILGGLECGLYITFGYICQSLALETTTSGKCAFICSLTVVFVPLVSALVYGKPIKPTNVAAAIVALSGVGILEGLVDMNELLGIQPAGAAESGAAAAVNALSSSSVETAAAGPISAMANAIGVSKGDILALGQPIGFGYSFTRIEYYQQKFKDVPGHTMANAAAQCVAVGILSLLWMLYDYHWSFPNMGYMIEPHRIATILWTGIVSTVFAIWLQGTALQTASATDAAITFSSEPVWASFFGFLILNEQMNTNLYVGGAVVMVACLIGALSDIKTEEEPSEEAQP